MRKINFPVFDLFPLVPFKKNCKVYASKVQNLAEFLLKKLD